MKFGDTQTVKAWRDDAGMPEGHISEMCDSCCTMVRLPMNSEQYKDVTKRGVKVAELGIDFTSEEIEFLEFGVCHKCFDEDAIGVEL